MIAAPSLLGQRLVLSSLFLLMPFGNGVAAEPAVRQSHDFNPGWRFTSGDHPDAREVESDDSDWQELRLPHDWAIGGPFDPEVDGYAAKLPWKGVGWYRKTFTLDTLPDARVYLDFDGVMAFPKVYVNGQLAGEWDYGYTAFRIDATPHVQPGENTIAIRVDTNRQGTRWYPGAGIYRKVTLEVTAPVHLAHWGIGITTPKVTDSAATIHLTAELESHLDDETEATLEFVVVSPSGEEVAAESIDWQLTPGTNTVESAFLIENPQRWDIDSPLLYTLRTTLKTDDNTFDTQETKFGIRTFEFTADDGFHLNGRRVQLYGVNLHHDLGPLGGAFNRRAMQRQLEIMQEMGVNAIRTAHNPSAVELLELCDEMGLVVWDECFDKWDHTAGRHQGEPPFEEHMDRHLRSMVLRDRNHPSVVAWSIGNEIVNADHNPEGKSLERVTLARDIILKYDDTRPVGLGCHIPNQTTMGVVEPLDFTGWNYARRYALYRETYPDRPIIYSESASALSTRGFYRLPLPTNKVDYSPEFQVNSYDLNAAPWSDLADVEFKLMERDDFVAGEFVWTGFDYLGEPTPFSKQARSSYFGIVDLCGFPKDRYYLYRSHWRPDTTTVHILPHWNWPDRVGEVVPVFVYTNGDSAELFVNGESQGRRTKGEVPPRPVDLALGQPATASSEQPRRLAADGSHRTRWTADSAHHEQWWQVDLGETQQLKTVLIEFERESKYFGHEIHISDDGEAWQKVAAQEASELPLYGGANEIIHEVDCQARWIRVVFNELREGNWAGMRSFSAYSSPAEARYYEPTYRYRLRWNDVVYQPGEVRVVAYREGQPIGEETIRTAGEPVALRLSADRDTLTADYDDLAFITIEAVDSEGIVHPLADHRVQLEVLGKGGLAAVDNGNPLSIDSFHADNVALFYGKALAIVRASDDSGEVKITASSDDLEGATMVLEVTP